MFTGMPTLCARRDSCSSLVDDDDDDDDDDNDDDAFVDSLFNESAASFGKLSNDAARRRCDNAKNEITRKY